MANLREKIKKEGELLEKDIADATYKQFEVTEIGQGAWRKFANIQSKLRLIAQLNIITKDLKTYGTNVQILGYERSDLMRMTQ